MRRSRVASAALPRRPGGQAAPAAVHRPLPRRLRKRFPIPSVSVPAFAEMDAGPVSISLRHRKPERSLSRAEHAADHPVAIGDVPKPARDPSDVKMMGLAARNPNETSIVQSHGNYRSQCKPKTCPQAERDCREHQEQRHHDKGLNRAAEIPIKRHGKPCSCSADLAILVLRIH